MSIMLAGIMGVEQAMATGAGGGGIELVTLALCASGIPYAEGTPQLAC